MKSPQQVLSTPYLFAKTFLKILDKEKQLVPFEWNNAQIDFHKKWTGKDIVLKARQLGFSTMIQGEKFRREVTSTQTTLTLAHDSETTQKMRRMADRFWEHCKFNNIQPQKKYSNAVLATYPEFDSTSIVATAGNVEVGRGDTYTFIHGSEVAFWPNPENIIAGAMQGGNPHVILESTPNGAQGWFYQTCMEALEQRSVWRLHFYPWWWDKQYRIQLTDEEKETWKETDDEKELVAKHNLSKAQIKWRRNKQRELGRKFVQEYPEDPIACFLVSGFGYFGNTSEFFKANPCPVYNPNHHYSAGLDFAQTVDFTSLSIFDHTIKEQVFRLRINKMPWAEQRRRIKVACQQWRIDVLLAEKNSIGDPNIEALRNAGLNVIPFQTTSESKSSIISSLNEALNYGGWKLLDDPVTKNQYNSFVATQLPSGAWRLAAASDSDHDDDVMADALALESGRHIPSDSEMERYGKDEFLEEELDDDIIAYRADSLGISFEEAKKQLLKER